MTTIPDTAVERLRKLEAKVDGWRAQYADLQAAFSHSRAEAGRLEGLLQGVGGGRRLEVDAEGCVFTREARGGAGVRRTVGLISTPDSSDGPHEVLRYLDDPVIAGRGRDIARLRAQVADLAARRDELAEKLHPVAALADACRRELLNRGWQEGEYAAVQMPTVMTRSA